MKDIKGEPFTPYQTSKEESFYQRLIVRRLRKYENSLSNTFTEIPKPKRIGKLC